MRELFEESIGDGPAPRSIDEQVQAGRRALRRRRRMGTAAGMAGVLVIAGAGWSLAGGGAGDDSSEPAPAGTVDTQAKDGRTADEAAAETKALAKAREIKRQQTLVSNQFPANFDQDGAVIVKEGWRITQRISNPMDWQLPRRSQGLSLTNGDRTLWMLITLDYDFDRSGKVTSDEGYPGAISDPPGKSTARLEDWLVLMAGTVGDNPNAPGGDGTAGGSANTTGVRMKDGQIVSTGDAEVLSQRVLPIIPDWSDAEGKVAKVRQDGRIRFVLFRFPDEQIGIDAAVLSAPTYEALFDHLRDQAASGEGVL